MNLRRSCHSQIATIPATGADELRNQLDQVGANKTSRETLMHSRRLKAAPKVSFVFSLAKKQWCGMEMRLTERELIFQEHLTEFGKIFR